MSGTIARTDELKHEEVFTSIYVNDVGSHAMLFEETPKFPPGSVIVKEKLPTRNAKRPELLTVMVKGSKGFNRATRNWEFLTLNGAGTRILDRDAQGKCLDCHLRPQGTDFVFRNYLPKAWFSKQTQQYVAQPPL